MNLYAISDLHVASPTTRHAVSSIAEHPDDWLILAGDIGETVPHLEWTLRTLRPRFRQLVWVPGNHDLWTLPSDPNQSRGESRYLQLVELCQALDVLTPEDPYPTWTTPGGETVVLAPLFLLYDYSFRRAGSTKDEAMNEAFSAGVVCTDEFLLHPDPYPSREEWCHSRVERSAARLAAIPSHRPTILISHFPMRQDLVFLPRIPQFSLWCGTTLTEDWHQRFHALAVVYGHLHIPRTSWRNEVRFEEVSLGQPNHWANLPTPDVPLRQVLPYP
ncbi:MAG TPA: metallophosphoesterase [Candidatus Dormibacteraeota bacterium]